MHSWFCNCRKSAKEFLTSCTMGLWLRGNLKIIFVMYIVDLLVVPVGAKGKVTGRATCESTGQGGQSQVTCYYSQNVVKTDHVSAVSLLHDTDGKLEKVVECHRFLNYGFDCLPKFGYKLNGAISDQMIINIPRARPEHQGTYYCELVIQDTEFQMESCHLEYKEPNNAATSTPPSEQDIDEHLKKDNGARDVKVWIHATIVLSVLLMIVILFEVLGFVRWRARCRRNRWQPDALVATPVDKIAISFPDFNTGDGIGQWKKDVGQLSDNITVKPEEVEDLLGDKSIGGNHDVSMAVNPPYTSKVHSAVDITLLSEDNSHRDYYSTGWFTEPSSSPPRPQFARKKASCAEDNSQSRYYNTGWFTYPGSRPPRPQFARQKPSCAKTIRRVDTTAQVGPQTPVESTSAAVCPRTDTVVRGHSSAHVGPKTLAYITGGK